MSPALRCGYEIETRAWFCAHAQQSTEIPSIPHLYYYTILYYSICICIYMYIAYARFAHTVHMLWLDHLNLACSGPGVNI